MDDRVCETKSAATERINLPKIAGLRFLQGALIGLGAVLPGISGGVLCVVFGVYKTVMELFSHGPDIKKTVSYSHSADFRRKLRFCRCGQNAGIFAGEIPGSVCMSVCGLNRRNAAVAVS